MSTITSGVVLPVAGGFNTSPAQSGAFIPIIWSSHLNQKFYPSSTFASVCNTDWEGEISNVGDKIIINNIPDILIQKYQPGAGLVYQVPTPSTIELQVDQGRYFAFQVSDVLKLQSNLPQMEMFSNDASMQMKSTVDSDCFYRTFLNGSSSNKGATAGAKSGGYNLGTEGSPFQLTSSTVLGLLTSFSGVFDEQNIPETDRALIIDPLTRTLLMSSNLAQAQMMGDGASVVRNGKIGQIDRFTTYVSNQLPRVAANGTSWVSGDGSDSSLSATTNVNKRRVIIACQKSALSFASQFTKVENTPNPYDFGTFVRGLNVYGTKVTKPEALAIAVVY